MISDKELADELEEAANHQSPAVLNHTAMKVVRKLRERDYKGDENSGKSDPTVAGKPGAVKASGDPKKE